MIDTGAWKRTKEAINAVLKRSAELGLQSDDLLPSNNSLTPLFVFHDRWHQHPDYSFNRLYRWFLLANRDGRYGGSAMTALNEDVRALCAAPDPDSALERLHSRIQVEAPSAQCAPVFLNVFRVKVQFHASRGSLRPNASRRVTRYGSCCVTQTGFCKRCDTAVLRRVAMTTDQEVGGSSPSGRASEALALEGLRRVGFSTVAESVLDFWVVSRSTSRSSEPVRNDPALRFENAEQVVAGAQNAKYPTHSAPKS